MAAILRTPIPGGTDNVTGAQMTPSVKGTVMDGANCKVVGGTHAGKSGVVRDIKTSNTGHITITVVQKDGMRFKTLAKNVVVAGRR